MKASRLHITRVVLAAVLLSAAVLAQVSAAAKVKTVPTAVTSAAAKVKTVPIINVYSHLPVDIVPGSFDASTKPYAKAFLSKNPAKDFDLIYDAGGNTKAFKIRVLKSGLCLMLDFRVPYYTNGTRVIQYNCDAKIRSKWWIAKRIVGIDAPPGENPSGYRYMLIFVNDYTGKCLDADNGEGGAPPFRALLQQWDCFEYSDDWNVGNQLWRDYE
jgi:hypothetical protein